MLCLNNDNTTRYSELFRVGNDVLLILSVPPVELICPIEGKNTFGIVVPTR